MALIKIGNISYSSAIQLLKNVQKNHAKSFAIQGSKSCRWINTDTVSATVKPLDEGYNEKNYAKCTFEMYSNYWTESTLNEFIQE